MARTLNAFPTQSRRSGYPWGEWTDGRVWEIRHGTDYEVGTHVMQSTLHQKASSLGRKVRTQRIDDGLVFQFLPTPGSAPRAGDSDADRRNAGALYADLANIYERARREVDIPRKDGRMQKYAAVRFMQAVDRAWEGGPVSLVEEVGRLVRRPTAGLNHLVEAGRPDLLAEQLVVDRRKPYHALFSEQTVHRAQSRLDDLRREHPEWPKPSTS